MIWVTHYVFLRVFGVGYGYFAPFRLTLEENVTFNQDDLHSFTHHHWARLSLMFFPPSLHLVSVITVCVKPLRTVFVWMH